MKKSVSNALKAMGILTAIAVVCVAILAVCNMFFPKYKPVLDATTAAQINSICPTGVSDEIAYSDEYIIMLDEEYYGSLDKFNKENKKSKATVLAVYVEMKGDNTGAYIVECSSAGRDGDIVLLVAYKDGKVFGASVKKQNESYFNKLPVDFLENAVGTDGSVNLKDIVGKTGATVSLTAVTRALNATSTFSDKYAQKIGEYVANPPQDGTGENNGDVKSV